MTRRTQRREFLRTVAATGTLGVGVAVAGCSESNGDGDGNGGDGTEAADATVDMNDNLKFDPDSITVSAGDTVVWENVGQVGHSVTAYEEKIPDDAEYFASGGFDSEETAKSEYAAGDAESGDIPGGESYRHTFEVPGTYEYFCIPHEMSGMVGTITVEE